jgi:hypothetical protein
MFLSPERVSDTDDWEFLDQEASKKIDAEYSGFLLVDYLYVYLRIRAADYFQRIDEYYSSLLPSAAVALAAYLRPRPVDRAAVQRYLKDDRRALTDSDREGTLSAYEEVHASLLEWCDSITEGSVGVLHLSF